MTNRRASKKVTSPTKSKKNTVHKDVEAVNKPASRLSKPNSVNGANNEYVDKPPKQLAKGKGRLLADDKDVKEDLALVDRALRERWDIKNKGMLQRRLLDVVAKTSVEVRTKAGPFDSEEAADANAISASKVLVQMNAQDQEDDHELAKLNKEVAPSTVVNINNADSIRSGLLEFARKFGARELIVGGRAIQTDGTNS